jgi:hypothetical protein
VDFQDDVTSGTGSSGRRLEGKAQLFNEDGVCHIAEVKKETYRSHCSKAHFFLTDAAEVNGTKSLSVWDPCTGQATCNGPPLEVSS